MDTGENSQGLHSALEFTRLLSIVVLLMHFYHIGYEAFVHWQITSKVTDQLFRNIEGTGLFKDFNLPKIISIGLLAVVLIGARGRKNDRIKWKTCLIYVLAGIGLFFSSGLIWLLPVYIEPKIEWYTLVTTTGYLFIMAGGTMLSRVIKQQLSEDTFNKANETFPQEERLLENEYSFNLPASYNLKGRTRKSWINVINPFRSTLVCGGPGAGKTFFVIRHVIKQHIQKGFSLFVYDFKYDDLSLLTYNYLRLFKTAYPVEPKFCVINFDNLSHSHRCNPLDPELMLDITDATESARTIMFGLNREWIRKQGDFWVESPIIFLTGIIWFLKKFNDGQYCTLPHVIELMQVPYDKLFSILQLEPEVRVFLNPFITAYLNDAMEQLEGQIAGAKIAMARLSSPQLYYIMTGNDFTLDINNPTEPKVFCAGNNPLKIQTYGAVLSLYINRLIKVVNRQGQHKCSLIFDEFPTIYLSNIDSLIATARSNKVATTLAVQDQSQLRKDYGKEHADVIMNIVGNVISGQVMGDTAEQLSKRFGRINQDRQSITIQTTETSINKSKHLDFAIPASTISTLSSEVADDPNQKIPQKFFHASIVNNYEQIIQEETSFQALPKIKDVTPQMVQEKYLSIKAEIDQIVEIQIENMMESPELSKLIIRKPSGNKK